MDERHLRKYAEVITKVGINLYEGQCVSVLAGPDDFAFALLLEETLYRCGAKYVALVIQSNHSLKSRLTHGKVSDLSFVPAYVQSEIHERIANDWAYIRIDNTGELGVLAEVDPSGLDAVFKSVRMARRRLLEVCSKHQQTWCVVAAPNPAWEAHVMKDAGPRAGRFDAALTAILRLDADDPAAAWQAHAAALSERTATLDALRLDKLVFESRTAQLEVGLASESRWQGGGDTTPDGRVFLPNIPTEEVFTTPDYRRTEGTVRCTRPVTVMETTLDGVWFEFKEGRIVGFGADGNAAVLENFVNTDEGARYLGEVALVDKASPIYQSNLVFNSILYDENASCHVAVGNGYPSCLANGPTLRTPDALRAAGCNTSLVHTDFMVGSDDLTVTGVDAGGAMTVIIEAGEFVI